MFETPLVPPSIGGGYKQKGYTNSAMITKRDKT